MVSGRLNVIILLLVIVLVFGSGSLSQESMVSDLDDSSVGELDEDQISYSPSSPVEGEFVTFTVTGTDYQYWSIGKSFIIERLDIGEEVVRNDYRVELVDIGTNGRSALLNITDMEADKSKVAIFRLDSGVSTLWDGSVVLEANDAFIGAFHTVAGLRLVTNHRNYYGKKIVHKFNEQGEYLVAIKNEDEEYLATKKVNVQEREELITLDQYQTSINYIVIGNISRNAQTPITWYASQFTGNQPKIITPETYQQKIKNDLSSSDTVILIGNPKNNQALKTYQENKATSVPQDYDYTLPNGRNLNEITYKENWKADQGYFLTQIFKDPETQAQIISIQGNNPDSTVAATYHFKEELIPNQWKYSETQFIAGKWSDNEDQRDTDFPKYLLREDEEIDGDINGFGEEDKVKELHRGNRLQD